MFNQTVMSAYAPAVASPAPAVRRVNRIFAMTGRVFGFARHSKTYVSGSGSNGNVSVGSTVVTTTEFWVRPDAGPERTFATQREDLAVRDGQAVTVIEVAGPRGPAMLAVVNHDARQVWRVGSGRQAVYEAGLVTAASFRAIFKWAMLAMAGLFVLALFAGTSDMQNPVGGLVGLVIAALLIALVIYIPLAMVQGVRASAWWGRLRPELDAALAYYAGRRW